MLDDLIDQLDALLEPRDADPAADSAMVPLNGDHALATNGGGPFTHASAGPALDALVLPPGADVHAYQLTLADPLTQMGSYGFEGFTLAHQHGLVDTNGDGVFDQTCWGTEVMQVETYVRADGTVVEGHYRTVPDGVRWNNLRR